MGTLCTGGISDQDYNEIGMENLYFAVIGKRAQEKQAQRCVDSKKTAGFLQQIEMFKKKDTNRVTKEDLLFHKKRALMLSLYYERLGIIFQKSIQTNDQTVTYYYDVLNNQKVNTDTYYIENPQSISWYYNEKEVYLLKASDGEGFHVCFDEIAPLLHYCGVSGIQEEPAQKKIKLNGKHIYAVANHEKDLLS